MTISEWKAKLERQGQIRHIDLVRSGSREIVTIGVAGSLRAVQSISAITALRRHGVPVLRAKRTIEAAIAGEPIIVEVPLVADADTLERELAEAGFEAKVRAREAPDVQALRERLGLTQDQFALRFGLDVDAVRNWEHKRRAPDTAARSLLKVIARFPDAVAEAQDDVSVQDG